MYRFDPLHFLLSERIEFVCAGSVRKLSAILVEMTCH